MSEVLYDLTPEQFGPLWKYIEDPEVTDIDFNGRTLQADIRQMRI